MLMCCMFVHMLCLSEYKVGLSSWPSLTVWASFLLKFDRFLALMAFLCWCAVKHHTNNQTPAVGTSWPFCDNINQLQTAIPSNVGQMHPVLFVDAPHAARMCYLLRIFLYQISCIWIPLKNIACAMIYIVEFFKKIPWSYAVLVNEQTMLMD